jgi:hypothetical protein
MTNDKKPIATYTEFCTECRQQKRPEQMVGFGGFDGKNYRHRCTACEYRARAQKVSA